MEKENKTPKKKVTKPRVAVVEEVTVEEITLTPKRFNMGKYVKLVLFLVILGGLGYLGYKNKQIFVAGKVGNTFIYTWEVDKRIVERYRPDALQEVITERMIETELKNLNITATSEELNQRISEIEKNLNGTSLEEALAAQGLTVASFTERVKLQVGLEKAVASRVTASEEEVSKFLTENETLLTSTDEQGKKAEAEKYVRDQKLNAEISNWVYELEAKYPVQKYL